MSNETKSTGKAKRVLGIDIGFGSTKIATMSATGQPIMEKYISAIAKVPKSSFIADKNAFEFNGETYYLFDNALKVSHDYLLDMMSYEGLKESSAIILRYILDKMGNFDKIVLGISVAMGQYSADYQKCISEILSIPIKTMQIVPQGVGIKIALDEYGFDPAQLDVDETTIPHNYLIADIGYNTLDVLTVINKSVSASAAKGTEGLGVIQMSNVLIERLKEEGYTVSIQDCKEILSTGIHKSRSVKRDVKELVDEIVFDYIVQLINTIEADHKDSLDKLDKIVFAGGGAALLKLRMDKLKPKLDELYPEDFIRIPESPEYYNVLGYLLEALK